MATPAKFVIADVFTATPFGGNQLAVFTDAGDLTQKQMQTLAREINFSESTFVVAPEAAAAIRRVRIFTPQREIPMAGHPTVGTTWVLAARGVIALDSAVVHATLQLGVGPTVMTIESSSGKPSFVWMAHREATFGATREDRGDIARALGIDAADVRDDLPIEIVSTGLPFIFVPIKSVAALGRCTPNESALAALFKTREERLPIHMFVVNETGEFGVRARMFAPHTDGIPEDPATGSAAAPFGAYAARHRLIPDAPKTRFIVDQGVEMGRPSRIHVEVTRTGSGIGLRIGGQCAIVGEGTLYV